MDIRQFELANPWRMGRGWQVPSIPRQILSRLVEWVDEPEVLVLSGARQAGKTSIVYQLISRLMKEHRVAANDIYYFNLDLPGFADFVAEPSSLLRFLGKLDRRRVFVFLDEVQRLEHPGLLVKGLQDMRLPLKFVLTGSSALDIRVKTGEALTGRKQVFRVHQLSFEEYLEAVGARLPSGPIAPQDAAVYLPELNHHLDSYATTGGYPAVVLSGDDDKRLARLTEIYVSYLEKDIAGFLKVGNLTAFRRLVTLLADQQGGLTNIQELAATLRIHRETVQRYIEYLEQTFVIRRVTPFFENPRTELSKMPKFYFEDQGLRNFGLGSLAPYPERRDRGQVAEGLVAQYVGAGLPGSSALHFWRTKSKAEVDFVYGARQSLCAVEVKGGALARPRLGAGFRSFLTKYEPTQAFLLNRALWTTVQHQQTAVHILPLAVFLARSA